MSRSLEEQQARGGQFITNFLEVLTAEASYYITQLPKTGTLTSNQLAELQRISNHFSSGVDNAETVTNSDNTPMEDTSSSTPTEQPENTTVSDDTVRGETVRTNPSVARQTPLSTIPAVDRKQRGRPRLFDTPPKINASSKNWGTILEKATFELDAELDDYLHQNLGPTLFVEKTHFLLPTKPRCKEFFDFCTRVSRMPKDNTVGRISRLFLLIRVGEIAVQLFGPNWSNEKSSTLRELTSDELDRSSFEKLKKLLRLSDRLIFICQCSEFGSGSIFWLQKELSSDNLLYNRISKSGEAYERVIKHVRDRELVASIREYRADRLADAILDDLRDKYNVDYLGTAVVDPAGGSELGGGAVASPNGVELS